MTDEAGGQSLSATHWDDISKGELNMLSEKAAGAMPEAQIVHRTKDRLRLRISSMKCKRGYFNVIAETCSDIEGIKSIETNPLTGSIKILHNSEMGTIVCALNQKAIFKIRGDEKCKDRLHKHIDSIFNNADRHITKATGGEMNLAMVAFLLLAGTGLFQLARGNFNALPWYTALWYASSLFRKTKLSS